MPIYKDITDFVGNTPLVRVARFEKAAGCAAALLAKCEYYNPAGSVKDRVAAAMIQDAEQSGRLTAGGTVIEPTSGNTGIGIAAVAAAKGYRAVLTMPETMSEERRRMIRAYGAEIVLTAAADGMRGAITKAQELCRQIKGAVLLGQFDNPANPQVHRAYTGPEIWRDTDGLVDIFVSAVGTGGTITGVGEYLKSRNQNVRIAAVEPKNSAVLSGGQAGAHAIQGIGAGFVPKVLNTKIYDEVIAVSDDDAFATARLLGETEGISAGISSGAALWAAAEIGKRPQNKGKKIVVLLPDGGDRYFSTPLFARA